MKNKVMKIVEALQGAGCCSVLTGAGVSTLSGIPDFRSEHGLYSDSRYSKLFDRDQFNTHPDRFYTLSAPLLYSEIAREPSIVHRVIAGLERKGLIRGVITQNIDMLHQGAGSQQVLALHGSLENHTCLQCGARFSFRYVQNILAAGEMVRCISCGGLIKPDIVFFGDSLPAAAWDAAFRLAAASDLMLVLGTSLTVYPAASLPECVLDNGGEIIIVNRDPTHLAARARLVLGDLGEVFAELGQRIL